MGDLQQSLLMDIDSGPAAGIRSTKRGYDDYKDTYASWQEQSDFTQFTASKRGRGETPLRRTEVSPSNAVFNDDGTHFTHGKFDYTPRSSFKFVEVSGTTYATDNIAQFRIEYGNYTCVREQPKFLPMDQCILYGTTKTRR